MELRKAKELGHFLHYNREFIQDLQIQIQNNIFSYVRFLHSCISLQVVETNKDWFFSDNIFSNCIIKETTKEIQGLNSAGLTSVILSQSDNNNFYFTNNYFKDTPTYSKS